MPSGKRSSRIVPIVALAFVCSPPLLALDSLKLELRAGKHARGDVPVFFKLTGEYARAKKLRLVRTDGEEKVVVTQRVPGDAPRLAWIARGEMAPGDVRRYRLEAGKGRSAADRVLSIDDGESLVYRFAGRSILRYNYGVVEPPDGVGPEFARSGYIHPVWTPSGRVITNDFPPHHQHHHGIWFPWTNTTFEGRKVDFWNSAAKQGRVEFVKMESFGGGPVFGHFRVRQRFVDLTAPGGPKVVLNEVWTVRVYALRDHFLFDLESRQTCASDSPLLLHKYRYGGLGFRGSGEWEGPGDRCEFLTSEGRTRKDGHATRARWCEISRKVDDEPVGIAVLCHPKNFRFPQPMRIHPSEPFFNFAPCQGGDFEISPGTPYVSRYRFYVHEGQADAGTAESVWRDYGEPPDVVVVD